MKRVFSFIVGLTLLVSACGKNDDSSGSYYVKYSGATSTKHLAMSNYTYTNEKGTTSSYRSSGFSTNFSVTIGPVNKGFMASVNCNCDETPALINTIKVDIEVSKNGEPFALKASGGGSASYIIDY